MPSISLDSPIVNAVETELAATVCICAHNEAHVLGDAVESVMAQRFSAEAYEVLVVDSASTDETPRKLAELQATWGERLRWVREDEPGLSRARNRGLAEALGAITAFIDADAIAEHDWLASIVDAFAAHPKAGAVGGAVTVQWDHPKPAWWRSELDEVFNHYTPGAPGAPGTPGMPGSSAKQLSYPKYPYGTNLAVRTEAAAALGGFANTLGRQGRTLLAGEDGEMCYRLEQAGWQVWFEPGARIRHRTKAERISKAYVRRRAFRHGRSQRAIERLHGFESGLYPSTLALLGLLLSRVLTMRCNLLFMKYWLFRAGYRWERLVGGGGETSQQINKSTSQQGRRLARGVGS